LGYAIRAPCERNDPGDSVDGYADFSQGNNSSRKATSGDGRIL
jgi:hypothetical protein